MGEILNYAEVIFYWLARLASIAVWLWVVIIMLQAFPLVLNRQKIQLQNLGIMGAAILVILLAIAYVPSMAVDSIEVSYDQTMPKLDRLVNRIIDDARTGYAPPPGSDATITIQDRATEPPPLLVNETTPTAAPPDVGGGAPDPAALTSTPPPTLTPTATPTSFRQAAPEEMLATATPVITATPSPLPTIDPDTWRPGTPAPTPVPWAPGPGEVWP